MDRLDRMRLFTRIVERGGFAAAAADLGLAPSTATAAIKALEADLGTRLLERTTRHVSPTLDGAAHYRRCLSILADVEEAEGAFRSGQPRGLLRIDAPGLLTRAFLLPRLPAFLEQYPDLDLHLGQSDRLVNLLREGVDCVIRAGTPEDSGLILRRLGSLAEVTCASPLYLARHGMPATPDALAGHSMVGFLSSRSGEVMPLEFTSDAQVRTALLPSRVTANDATTAADLARLGFGLIQAPRYRFRADLAAGAMVEVLPDYPPPPMQLSAIYPRKWQLSPRLRVFLDWVAGIFAEADM